MVSPSPDIIDLFMQLPVGLPYFYTRHERGQDDGYYGRDPRDNDPEYMSGYAEGVEMFLARMEVKRAKEAQAQEQHLPL